MFCKIEQRFLLTLTALIPGEVRHTIYSLAELQLQEFF